MRVPPQRTGDGGEPGPAPAAPDAGPDTRAFEAALGHRFTDRDLLRVALTHRSWSHEQGEEENYERLEFLGDAVLGLTTAEWLFERFPEAPEGELAKLKSYLVSARVLGAWGRRIGLGECFRLGVGEHRSGGRKKRSILADGLEAIFGAVYLDAGLDAARRVIAPGLEAALAERVQGDSKTRLQERAQGAGLGLPTYRLVSENGPDHQKVFTVECEIGGRVLGKADGRSKKQAEQRAATVAITALDREAPGP